MVQYGAVKFRRFEEAGSLLRLQQLSLPKSAVKCSMVQSESAVWCSKVVIVNELGVGSCSKLHNLVKTGCTTTDPHGVLIRCPHGFTT